MDKFYKVQEVRPQLAEAVSIKAPREELRMTLKDGQGLDKVERKGHPRRQGQDEQRQSSGRAPGMHRSAPP